MQNRISKIIFAVAAMIGLVLTAFGLLDLQSSIGEIHGLTIKYELLVISIIFVVISGFVAVRYDVSSLQIGTVLLFAVAMITNTIWPLCTALLFFGASFVVGRKTLSILGFRENKPATIVELLVGTGVYGTFTGLIAHFPVSYPWVYAILLIFPVLLGRRQIYNMMLLVWRQQSTQPRGDWISYGIVFITLFLFVLALMPEIGHDALAMHLFIPSHMAANHEWGFDVETYVWAAMPAMGDWIYTIVYVLAGETAARIVNYSFILVLARLTGEIVIWAGGGARGAKIASLILLTTPLIFAETSSLFIDSAWSAFVVAGVFSLLRAISPEDDAGVHFLPSGIMLGFSLASKAVSLAILPILVLLLLVFIRKWFRLEYAKPVLLGFVLFCLAGGIPYTTAWYITGNPVFPFFNAYFQAPQYPPINFSAPAIFEKGISWDTIYRITFDSSKYLEAKPGAAGFQWLLLCIPAALYVFLEKNYKAMTILFVGVMSVVLIFQQTAYLRYIVPSYVLLGAVIGVVVSDMGLSRNRLTAKLMYMLVILTISLNIVFIKSATWYGHISGKPLFSERGRVDYLQHIRPIRNAVQLLNYVNTGKAPVAVFAPPLTAGLVSDALYSSWYNHRFDSDTEEVKNGSELADVLLDYGVVYLIVDSQKNNAGRMQMFAEISSTVADYGNISVRKIKQELRFNTELLKNPSISGADGWHISPGLVYREKGGVVVRKKVSATQLVKVVPGRGYMQTVNALCPHEPSQARLQVNWLDSQKNLVRPDIQVFNCSEKPESHSVIWHAPEQSAFANVYATGHTDKPVTITRVSFRK